LLLVVVLNQAMRVLSSGISSSGNNNAPTLLWEHL